MYSTFDRDDMGEDLQKLLLAVQEAEVKESKKLQIKAKFAFGIFCHYGFFILSTVFPIFVLFLPGVSWWIKTPLTAWVLLNGYGIFYSLMRHCGLDLSIEDYYTTPLPSPEFKSWTWSDTFNYVVIMPIASAIFAFYTTRVFLKKGVWTHVHAKHYQNARVVLNDERTEFLLRLAAEIDAWNESIVFLQTNLDFHETGLIQRTVSDKTKREYDKKHALIVKSIETARRLLINDLLGDRPMTVSTQRGLVSPIPLVDYGPELPNIIHELDEPFV